MFMLFHNTATHCVLYHTGDDGGGGEEVSEEQVQQMVEMGFSQDQVRHALHVSNNDVSVATNFLLQQN